MGDTVYVAWGGSAGSGKSQGGVVIWTFTHGPVSNTPGVFKTYLTAGHDGPLTIVSAHGLTITLRAADGVRYVFSVRTGRYA